MQKNVCQYLNPAPQSENEMLKKDDKNPEALCVFPHKILMKRDWN